jgi:hypothetical protein
MSDEPKASWTKAVRQLVGIAALAIAFVACLRGGHPSESPFRKAEHRLRAGMSIDEAFAVIDVGPPNCGDGSLWSQDYLWFDEGRGEMLCLHFETRGNLLAGNDIDRLTEWGVESTSQPR